MSDAPDPAAIEQELAALYIRWQNGFDWIVEHDPDGSMYYWVKSGLTPSSPMPGQAEARREAWAAFYKAFRLWEALDQRVLALERRLTAATANLAAAGGT
jgi:hypothetical protein